MEKYKRLGRTLVHKGKITSFYTDRMLLPNGVEADWDFIDHKGAAAFVAETKDGKILMVRQDGLFHLSFLLIFFVIHWRYRQEA